MVLRVERHAYFDHEGLPPYRPRLSVRGLLLHEARSNYSAIKFGACSTLHKMYGWRSELSVEHLAPDILSFAINDRGTKSRIGYLTPPTPRDVVVVHKTYGKEKGPVLDWPLITYAGDLV